MKSVLAACLALAVASRGQAGDGASVLMTRLKVAQALWDRGEYSRAESVLRPALREAEDVRVEGAVKAHAYRCLGLVCQVLAKAMEAERHWRRAVDLFAAIGPAAAIPQLRSRIYLASLYVRWRQYRKARSLGLETAVAEIQPRGNEALLADAYSVLAYVAARTGHPGKAEYLLHHGLSLLEGVAPDRVEAMWTLNRLADLYIQTGRPGEALAFHRRAWRIAELRLGEEHPDRAALLLTDAAATGKLYGARHAEPMLRRALALAESGLGSEHPFFSHLLGRYAGVARELGWKSEARACLRRAEAIRNSWAAEDPRRHVVDCSGLLSRPR